MKGYIIVDELSNYPLYICSSRKNANKFIKEIDIPCYIQEIPFIQPSSLFLEVLLYLKNQIFRQIIN